MHGERVICQREEQNIYHLTQLRRWQVRVLRALHYAQQPPLKPNRAQQNTIPLDRCRCNHSKLLPRAASIRTSRAALRCAQATGTPSRAPHHQGWAAAGAQTAALALPVPLTS
jgi:hypothetical protein